MVAVDLVEGVALLLGAMEHIQNFLLLQLGI
jgi:hypothetical protein